MSANAGEIATEMGEKHYKAGHDVKLSIPSEFSKSKENISNNETGDAEEKLLNAMKCSVDPSKNFHTCGLDYLFQKEIANGEYNQGTEYDNLTGNEDDYKQKESACVKSYIATGLRADSQYVQDGIGMNKLTPPPETPWYIKFMRAQCGIFSMLLWFGGFLCFVGYSLDQTSPDNLYLGVVLCVVVFLTGVFEYFQEAESAKTMEGFANMMPPQVNAVRDGKDVSFDAIDLCVGDVIKLEMGQKIAADVRMLQVTNLKVEQSSLTGEPDAIGKKTLAPVPGDKAWENPLEAGNVAFFGTEISTGTATAVVILVGDNTIMGNIAQLAAVGETPPTPISIEIHRFIIIVSSVAIFLGVTFLIVCLVQQKDPIQTLVFVIGIIVANVPEGLLATVTVSLTLTAVRLGKKNVKVKDLEGVETLGSTTCICSDKTGTLTQNKMTAFHVYMDFEADETPSKSYEVNAITSSAFGDPVPKFKYEDLALMKLLWCCNLVNQTTFTRSKKEFVGTSKDNMKTHIQERGCANGNASDIAFFKFAEGIYWKLTGKPQDPQQSAAEEARKVQPAAQVAKEDGSTQKVIIPFNSKYKFMVSVNWVADPSQGGKMRPAVLMKGAAELIFQRCSRMVKGDGYEDITSEKVEHFQAAQKDLAGRGERVIGFCMKFLDEDDTYNCVNQPGESDVMTVNGAPFDSSGEPLDPNKEGYYPIGSKQFLDWGGDDNINGCMTSQGLTPPEAAWDSMDFVGLISLIDPPREAVPGSVLLCRKAGVKVVMVTGDQPLTAAAIARKVNIIKEGAMTIEDYAAHHGLDYDGTAATISSVEQHAMSAYQNMPQEQRESDEYSHLRYTKSMIEAKVIPGWELKSMSTEDIKTAFMYRDLVFAPRLRNKNSKSCKLRRTWATWWQ